MNSLVLENQIINAAIDSNDVHFFSRLGVDQSWFTALPQAFAFFESHCREYGEVPSVTTLETAQVTAQTPQGAKKMTLRELGFDSSPGYDSPEVMRRKLANLCAKREIEQRLGSLDSSKMSAVELAHRQAAIASEVVAKWKLVESSGLDIVRSGDAVASEYEARKSGKVGVKIPTPFATLNARLGGGSETGDEIVLIAFTNRGKSWLAALFGETANHHGFKVVHASLEMGRARPLFRWHSMRSYRQLGRGFSNRAMLGGRLEDVDEAKLYDYLAQFGGANDAPGYLLKTRGDYPRGVTIEAIERDIVENDLSGGMYILDQLNLCDYHALPGGMKEFHRRLNALFLKHNVAAVVLTQANGDSEKRKEKAEDGERILKAPDLTAYSETIAVIQDARTIITLDSLRDEAVISLEKATDCEPGEAIPLFWNVDAGEICEFSDEIRRQRAAAGDIARF